MQFGDWSSDVCSSDLSSQTGPPVREHDGSRPAFLTTHHCPLPSRLPIDLFLVSIWVPPGGGDANGRPLRRRHIDLQPRRRDPCRNICPVLTLTAMDRRGSGLSFQPNQCYGRIVKLLIFVAKQRACNMRIIFHRELKTGKDMVVDFSQMSLISRKC